MSADPGDQSVNRGARTNPALAVTNFKAFPKDDLGRPSSLAPQALLACISLCLVVFLY